MLRGLIVSHAVMLYYIKLQNVIINIKVKALNEHHSLISVCSILTLKSSV